MVGQWYGGGGKVLGTLVGEEDDNNKGAPYGWG